MVEFCALRSKAYAFLLDDNTEEKKAKETKICVVAKTLRFNDYKRALFDDEIIYRTQQRFKSYNHDI